VTRKAPLLAELAEAARASRPDYFDDPTIDALLELILSQAEKKAILKDRLKTAQYFGKISDEDIDAFDIPAEIIEERLADHQQDMEDLMRQILQAMDKS